MALMVLSGERSAINCLLTDTRCVERRVKTSNARSSASSKERRPGARGLDTDSCHCYFGTDGGR